MLFFASSSSGLLSPLLPGLPGSLDKGPLHGNGLAQDIIAIQLFLGCQSFFVCLVLYQGVTLEEPRPSVQVQMNILQKEEELKSQSGWRVENSP